MCSGLKCGETNDSRQFEREPAWDSGARRPRLKGDARLSSQFRSMSIEPQSVFAVFLLQVVLEPIQHGAKQLEVRSTIAFVMAMMRLFKVGLADIAR